MANRRKDDTIEQLAIDIGRTISDDGFLTLINSYMAAHAIAEFRFELIPPSPLEKDPQWHLKYSGRAFEEDKG